MNQKQELPFDLSLLASLGIKLFCIESLTFTVIRINNLKCAVIKIVYLLEVIEGVTCVAAHSDCAGLSGVSAAARSSDRYLSPNEGSGREMNEPINQFLHTSYNI